MITGSDAGEWLAAENVRQVGAAATGAATQQKNTLEYL
jgi:hypothetical protein